jgi:hypothetical protein
VRLALKHGVRDVAAPQRLTGGGAGSGSGSSASASASGAGSGAGGGEAQKRVRSAAADEEEEEEEKVWHTYFVLCLLEVCGGERGAASDL